MKHEIYREGSILAVVRMEGSWQSKVMGEDLAQSTWVMSSMVEFQKGDYILKNGFKYILSGRPSAVESSTLKYEYTGSFEADAPYSLIDTQYFMYDQDNQLTLSEFSLTGKPSTFLNLLIKNANRRSSGWSLGVIDDEAEAITLSFSDDDNCRTVLTKLAEAFKTEFWFDNKTIHLTKKGNATGIEFAYGHGKGLYEVKGLTPDDFQLITKLYYFGGSSNLPVGYRKNSAGVASSKLLGSSRFLLADQETINYSGVIERSKTFPDIFPKREGVISGLGSKANVVIDSSLNFDINTQIQPGLTAKISFTTGNLAGYQFEIYSYNSSSKTIEFNINKDEIAFGPEGLPNQFLKPAVGDKYVLFDLQMPAQYVTEAELKLDQAALELLNNSKRKPIKCEVTCSPAFIAQHNLFNIKIGDYCTVKSPVLNGSVNIRIVGVTVDMQDPSKITLELADEVTISAIIRNIIEKDNIVNVINLNKLYDINRARRNTKTVSELQNYIVDPEGNYYPEKIRAGSVETLYLSIGAKATNFSLRGIGFTANFSGEPSVFDISAGQLVHFAIEIPGVGFVWNMEARRFTNLDPAKTYYVYARVSRTSLVGTWVISENVITAEQEAGYFNFQSGVLFAVLDGRRDHEFTKGMTFIIGDQITAGILKDLSGLNFFNLTDGTFNLGAVNSGIDYGVSIPDTLSAQKIVIGYGDYISVIGNDGAWPLAIGAPSFNKPEEAKFRVSRNGTMYAKQAVIEGTITAGAGSKIGDIIIDASGKFNLAGTKVELKPDESIRVYNNGIADFSDATLFIPTKAPAISLNKASLWAANLSGITNAGGSGSEYILPIATATLLGGVKIGTGLNITPAGVVSINGDAFDLSNYYTKTQSDSKFTLTNGSNAVAGSTWNINILGNSGSANIWAGQSYRPVEINDTSFNYFLAYDGVNWRPTTPYAVSRKLGLGTASQYNAEVNSIPNSVVLRSDQAHIYASYFNTAATIEQGTMRAVMGLNNSDGFIRPFDKVSLSGFLSLGDFVDKVSAQTITGLKTFANGAIFQRNLIVPTISPTSIGNGQASLWVANLSGITNTGGSGGDYILPIASATILGGVKVGTGLNITLDGTLSINGDAFDLSNYYTKTQSDSRFAFVGGENVNAGSTWNINILGNSRSATIWNGNSYYPVELNGDFTYFMAFDGASWRPTTISAVQTRLGLGSFAYRNQITGSEVITSYDNSANDINVAKVLRWKNYGSNHVIFDASQGTMPTGQTVSNKDSQTPWSPTYPTLMGANGNSTFGVRVDSARVADNWGSYVASVNADANTLALRNPQGQLFATYFNTTASVESGSIRGVFGLNQADGYMRSFNADSVANFLETTDRHWRLTYNTNDLAFNTGTLELRNSTNRPVLGFHWGGVVGSTVSVDSKGAILIMKGNGSEMENLRALGGYFDSLVSTAKLAVGYDSGVPFSVNTQWLYATQTIQSNTHILSGSGTDGGYSNQGYSQGHNNIWRLNNAKNYGMAYYQASPNDAIGFHFGDRNSPVHRFDEAGNYKTSGKIETSVDGVSSDPYGIISVTRGQASNFSYYGLTRSGSIGWGIGIATSAGLIFGTGSTNAGIIPTINMSLGINGDMAVRASVQSPVLQADATLVVPSVAPASVPNGRAAMWVGNLSGITN